MPILSDREFPNLSDNMQLRQLEKGQYARIAFAFDIDRYLVAYKKLYAYLAEHNLTPLSPIYEISYPSNR